MSGVEPAVALSFAQELIAQRDQLSRRVAQLEGALRNLLADVDNPASDTEPASHMQARAALKGQG